MDKIDALTIIAGVAGGFILFSIVAGALLYLMGRLSSKSVEQNDRR